MLGWVAVHADDVNEFRFEVRVGGHFERGPLPRAQTPFAPHLGDDVFTDPVTRTKRSCRPALRFVVGHCVEGVVDDRFEHCGLGSGSSSAEINTTGLHSTNQVNYNNDTDVDINLSNNTDVNIDVNQDADSGNAEVSHNTNGGSATSGNASNSSSLSISVSNKN